MYKVIALAFLTLFTGLALAAEPFDFKGVPLGASEKEFLEKIYTPGNHRGRLECSTRGPRENTHGDRVCHAENDLSGIEFAETKILNPTFYFIDDKLAHIRFTIKGFSFKSVTDAITQKYGAPKRGTVRSFVCKA